MGAKSFVILAVRMERLFCRYSRGLTSLRSVSLEKFVRRSDAEPRLLKLHQRRRRTEVIFSRIHLTDSNVPRFKAPLMRLKTSKEHTHAKKDSLDSDSCWSGICRRNSNRFGAAERRRNSRLDSAATGSRK